MAERHIFDKVLAPVLLCCSLLLPWQTGCGNNVIKSEEPYLISSVTEKNNVKKSVRYYYDDNFRVIKRNTYNKDSLYTAETMTYDKNGYQNSTSESTAVLGYEEKDVWENDDAGRKLSGSVTTTQFGDETVTKYTYTYNEKGQVILYTETDEDGNLIEEKSWTYTDDYGSSICSSLYSVVEEVLNASGKRLSYVVKTKDGTETSRYRYTYDDNGNVIEDESNGVTTQYENSYEKDKLTKTVSTVDGAVTAVTEYSYDEGGRLIQCYVKDSSGAVTEKTVMTYSVLPTE